MPLPRGVWDWSLRRKYLPTRGGRGQFGREPLKLQEKENQFSSLVLPETSKGCEFNCIRAVATKS